MTETEKLPGRLSLLWFICPLCKSKFSSNKKFIEHQIKEHSHQLKNRANSHHNSSGLNSASQNQNATGTIVLRGESGKTIKLKVMTQKLDQVKSQLASQNEAEDQKLNQSQSQEQYQNLDEPEDTTLDLDIINEVHHGDGDTVDYNNLNTDFDYDYDDHDEIYAPTFMECSMDEPAEANRYRVERIAGLPPADSFPSMANRNKIRSLLVANEVLENINFKRPVETTTIAPKPNTRRNSKPKKGIRPLSVSEKKTFRQLFLESKGLSKSSASTTIISKSAKGVGQKKISRTPPILVNLEDEDDEEQEKELKCSNNKNNRKDGEIQSEEYLYCPNCLQNFQSAVSLDSHLASCGVSHSNFAVESESYVGEEEGEYLQDNNKVKSTIVNSLNLNNINRPTLIKNKEGKYFLVKKKQNNAELPASSSTSIISKCSNDGGGSSGVNKILNSNHGLCNDLSSPSPSSSSKRIAFRCATCSKIFLDLSELQSHRLIHSNGLALPGGS